MTDTKAKENRERYDEGRVVSLPYDEAQALIGDLLRAGERFTVDAKKRPGTNPWTTGTRILIAKVTDL